MPRDAAEEEPTSRESSERTRAPEDGSLAEQPTLHADSSELETLAANRSVAEVEWEGRTVQGRYRVERKLGEGGMGMVYEAEHIHLKKRVAFKVIHPSLAANEELLARFTREALATGQLDHAHICAAIDFEQLPDGSAFLVMPFVRGHSLQAELDSYGALPWRTVCRYGSQIADALSAAHAVGIVHRDLKPDNVHIETLPDGSRSAKVLDFGVASLTGTSQSLTHTDARPLTQAGMILGTPGYMSPEQATAGEIDHRTDLYALGVILWELAAGQRLFSGEDVTHIFARQFQGAPDVVGLDAVGPPRELAELTMRLLATHKEDRPESAAEVRDLLRRLAEAPEPSALQVQGTRGWRALREQAIRGWNLGRARWQRLSSRDRLWTLGAAALFAGLLAWLSSGDPDADSERPQATSTGEPAGGEKAEAAAKEEASGDESPEETPPKPTLAEKVKGMFAGGLPPEIEEARDTLMEGESRKERTQAARAVLDHEPAADVPEYLRLSAQLELARGCRGKRNALRELTELGDGQALPIVKRLDAQPRRGCPPFNLRDCLACMRDDIGAALQALD